MTGIAAYTAVFASLILGIYRAPVIAIALMICMFGLEQWAQSTSPFFFQHITLTNYLVGSLVVFAVTLKGVRERDISLSYGTAGTLVLVLFLYAFVSLLWAPNEVKGWSKWSSEFPYIVTTLVLAPLLINRVSDFQKICACTLLLGAPLVLWMLNFGDWSGRQLVLAGGGEEGLGNPLAVADMASYVALAAIFLHTQKFALVQRVLRWLLVGACLMLVVKSGSRGQFFGVLIVAALILLFTLPSRGVRGGLWSMAGLGATLLLGGWVLASFGDTDRWSEDEMMDAGVDGRWNPAIELLRHWYSSPETFFFGLGNSAAYEAIGAYPHVVALEVLGEEGLVGFVIFVAIIYLAMRSFLRAYGVMKHAEAAKGTVLTVGAWFFFALFISFKQGSLVGSLSVFLFAIMLNKFALLMTAYPARNTGEAPSAFIADFSDQEKQKL